MNKLSIKRGVVSLKELRENMAKYIARVDNGESFTVLRRSKPIFKLTPVDDEESWETVADFTAIDKRGIPAREVLTALRKLHGEN